MTSRRSDGPWQEEAACLDVDPELFTPPGTKPNWEPARAVCGTCPVKAECLEDAPVDDVWSMRGGLTPDERRALRPRTPKPPVPIVHGTATGARLHYRRGTRPCPPCAKASNLARREFEERKRQAAS